MARDVGYSIEKSEAVLKFEMITFLSLYCVSCKNVSRRESDYSTAVKANDRRTAANLPDPTAVISS